MSTTYTLVCDDCKRKYWAGQSSYAIRYLYDEKKVTEFMFGHAGHRIRFLNDHVEYPETFDYADCEDEL